MKRAAVGAHLPTPWLFEPANRPDDRADYCLEGKIPPPSASTRYSFLHLSGENRDIKIIRYRNSIKPGLQFGDIVCIQ